jgi:hypothetical protein
MRGWSNSRLDARDVLHGFLISDCGDGMEIIGEAQKFSFTNDAS